MLHKCAVRLMEAREVLTPGGELKHVRGELNLGVGGGPDILRAVYGLVLEEDGFLTNRAGDGLYYIVSWDRNGNLEAGCISMGATLDGLHLITQIKHRIMSMRKCMILGLRKKISPT